MDADGLLLVMKPDLLAPLVAAPVDRRGRAVWSAIVMAGALILAPAASEGANGDPESSTELSPEVVGEIEQVRARIAVIEEETLARVVTPPDNRVQQVELLGKVLMYDEQLSVNRNEACPSAIRRKPGSPARSRS
jgi:hypothetical protein